MFLYAKDSIVLNFFINDVPLINGWDEENLNCIICNLIKIICKKGKDKVYSCQLVYGLISMIIISFNLIIARNYHDRQRR